MKAKLTRKQHRARLFHTMIGYSAANMHGLLNLHTQLINQNYSDNDLDEIIEVVIAAQRTLQHELRKRQRDLMAAGR